MRTVNVLEAKTTLSRLIEAVESGAEKEIIIARNGKPAARLVPLAKRRPVVLGLGRLSEDQYHTAVAPLFTGEIDAEITATFNEDGADYESHLDEAVLLDPRKLKQRP